MLLEGVVAVLALATVMMLPGGSSELSMDPNLVYARGLSNYMGLLGISFNVAFPFALLAFSTFVYDTLDVSTRLARYVFQELTGWKSFRGGCAATFISLLIPLAFLLLAKEKAYLLAWPIFGTSNQMLASLTLLRWQRGSSIAQEGSLCYLPMVFMIVMTMTALILQVLPFIRSLNEMANGAAIKPDVMISGI
jgi:carbon starvation protein